MRSLLLLVAAAGCGGAPPPVGGIEPTATCFAGDGEATIRRPDEPAGRLAPYRVVVLRDHLGDAMTETRTYSDEARPPHVDERWVLRAGELAIGGETLRGASAGDDTGWSFAGRDVRIAERVTDGVLASDYVERDPTGEPRVERHEHLRAIDCRAYPAERAAIAQR